MKICIVKLSAMGDIIHAMVGLQFLKQHNKNIQIDWVVESSFSGILQNNPDITNILEVDLKSIKKDKSKIFSQFKLLKSYAKNNYDIVIDAQGLLKSAIVSKTIGAKTIVGFDRFSIREKVASWFYDYKVNISYDSNTIDRNIRVMCDYFGIEVTKQMIEQKKQFLFFKDYTMELENNYNIFIVNSTWESRNYPMEYFVAIAEKLKIPTYVVWANEIELKKAQQMAKSSDCIKIVPKLTLDKLKYVIYNSNILIGNDTGPTHIAWGLNKPSITIFGPTPLNRIYITDINKAIKSKSVIDHKKLDKSDFSICEIKPKEILKLIKDIDV